MTPPQPEPHPQRCATCTDKECQIHENNEKNWKTKAEQRYLRAIRIAITSVGCASHSSRPAPAPAPTPEMIWRCCEFQSRPVNNDPVKCIMVEEGARAEREQVLDAFDLFIDAHVYNDMTGIVLKRSELDVFIKSLRGGGK